MDVGNQLVTAFGNATSYSMAFLGSFIGFVLITSLTLVVIRRITGGDT